ncbi:MAG: hypothetical protein CML13_01400 [Puniceicoccaceae bacterium]|nr:hypothetical protein [Puniceicoccaceae bacterium]|tara:strand:+ start:14020 stop:16980 length:2961 start_codon:yes stop_codon:yes gene_type:complete
MSCLEKHNWKKRGVALGALTSVGLLSAAIVSEEDLEANKPVLNVNKSGNSLIIDWDAQPEVYYFVEGSPDLTNWMPAKLLKDNAGTGSLSIADMMGSSKGFYRLSLEGDPSSARLRADDDGDGIINLLEVDNNWDAFETASSVDSEPDGIPDYWELFHFDTLEHDGTYVAVVGGLTLAEAYAAGTDPKLIDSDGDGWTDSQELNWGWEVNYDQSRDEDRYGQSGDFDGDGFSNLTELLNGTDLFDSTDAPPLPPSYTIINLSAQVGVDREFLKLTNEGRVLVHDFGDDNTGSHHPVDLLWHWGEVSTIDLSFFSHEAIAEDGTLYGIYNSPPLDPVWESVQGLYYPDTYGDCGAEAVNNYFGEYVYGVMHVGDSTPTILKPPIELLFDFGCSVTPEYSQFLSISDNGSAVAGFVPYHEGNSVGERTFFYKAQIVGDEIGVLTKYFLGDSALAGFISLSNNGDVLYSYRQNSSGPFQYRLNGNALNVDRIDSYHRSGEILAQQNGQTVLLSSSGQMMSILDQVESYGDLAKQDGRYYILNKVLNVQNLDPVTGDLVDLAAENAFAKYPIEDLFETEEWEDIYSEKMSDNALFIVLSAVKNHEVHTLLLLKMDVAAHAPVEIIDDDGELQKGVQVPARYEDEPSNLKFVINDDNDDRRAYSSSYPKDFDVLDQFGKIEDDLVAVTFQFPKEIETGTLEISANVNRANPEARAYIISPQGDFKPTKELVTLYPQTSIDLSAATETDLLWELANEGEQTLYIEGLAAKDDLEVKLTFKANGADLASDSVHMQILPSTERNLKVLARSGLADRAMIHMNNADNSLRNDHDGYNGDEDRVTPIAFRQDGAVSSSGIPQSWNSVDVSSNDGKTNAIFIQLDELERNVFVCEYLYGATGFARRGEGIMILGAPWVAMQSGGAPQEVLAHEWLHAFADEGHVNITDDIMYGVFPPPEEVDTNENGILDGSETMAAPGHGGNVSEAQYNSFINLIP